MYELSDTKFESSDKSLKHVHVFNVILYQNVICEVIK